MEKKIEDKFEETLVFGTEDELNELKNWLFKENIRLSNEKSEFQAIQQKFVNERAQFQSEMKELNQKMVIEKKRLKEDIAFFDKKMAILKNGFTQLDIDRRRLEKEKMRVEAEKAVVERDSYSSRSNEIAELLFSGVNSPLALKKRYKDLMKMFHPDNVAGDHDMVLTINRIYEELRRAYDVGRQA